MSTASGFLAGVQAIKDLLPDRKPTRKEISRAETRLADLPKKKRTKKEREALIADEMTRHAMPNRAALRKAGIRGTHATTWAPDARKRADEKQGAVSTARTRQIIEANNRRLRTVARRQDRRRRLLLDVPVTATTHEVLVYEDGSWDDVLRHPVESEHG